MNWNFYFLILSLENLILNMKNHLENRQLAMLQDKTQDRLYQIQYEI